MHKTLCFFSFLLAGSLSAAAQAYLLPEFKVSVATVKRGGQPIQACFNYNCVTRSMEFKEGEEVLRLDPISHIDTLYLDCHKMIPYGVRFLDVVYASSRFSLLVDYKRIKINKGKKGGMGLTTQGTVENVDFSAYGGRHTEEWKKGNEVWQFRDENTYLYVVKSKMKKFHNEKRLVKLFPEKEDVIREYVKAHAVRFDQPQAVLELLQECLPPEN